MAVILFRLNRVPEDEAEDIRALLSEHDIAFYETSAGNWGVSFAAIWLGDESRLPEARRLIDRYQAERRRRLQEEYRQRKNQRGTSVVLDALRENPLRSVLYIGVILVIVYLSTVPFFNFTEWL